MMRHTHHSSPRRLPQVTRSTFRVATIRVHSSGDAGPYDPREDIAAGAVYYHGPDGCHVEILDIYEDARGDWYVEYAPLGEDVDMPVDRSNGRVQTAAQFVIDVDAIW